MPDYTLSLPGGRKFIVTAPTPPTEQQLWEAYYAGRGRLEAAEPSLVDQATRVATAIVSPIYRGAVKPALEGWGRSQEYTTGAATGFLSGLKKGGVMEALAEGHRRGREAFLEPTLTDSKISESYGRLIEEQFPEFAQAHPYLTIGGGLIGDIVLDPANLAFGSGIVRKGIQKGLQAAGMSKRAAEIATLVPISEQVQKRIITPAAQAMTRAAAASAPLRRMITDLPLKAEVGRVTGRTAKASKQLAELSQDVLDEQASAAIASITSKYKLTPAEDDLLAIAQGFPRSPEAQQVMADPRLSAAKSELTDIIDQRFQLETQKGFQPGRRALSFEPELQTSLNALTPADQGLLQGALRSATGPDGYVDSAALAAQLPTTRLRQIADALVRSVTAESEKYKGTPLADAYRYMLADLSGVVLTRKGKTVNVTVPQKLKNYLPAKSTEEAKAAREVGLTKTFAVVNPALLASKAKQANPLEYLEEAARKAGLPTPEGRGAGYSTLLATRLYASNRAMTGARRLQDIATDFGEWALPGTASQAELVKLPSNVIEVLPNRMRQLFQNEVGKDAAGNSIYEYLHLPPAIVEDITRTQEKLQNVRDVETIVDRGLKLFRGIATSGNIPAHHSLNFTGDLLQMYSATPMTVPEVFAGFTQAYRALHHGKELPSLVINGRKVRGRDIVNVLARQYGTIGNPASLAQLDATAHGQRMTKTAKFVFGQKGVLNPLALLNPDNAFFKWSRLKNEKNIEEPARLATFYYYLKNGLSPEDAALQVNRILFNGKDLTGFEKKFMRFLMPFYAWTRQNVPLQLSLLATAPQKLQHQQRFLNAIWTLSRADQVQDTETEALPDYLQTGDVIPLPGVGESTDLMSYTRARLPMFEANLLASDPEELGSRLGYMLNPAVKAALPYAGVGLQYLMGRPPFESDEPRDAPAGLLGRLSAQAGVPELTGTFQNTEGEWRQPEETRRLLDLMPIPFGWAARTLDVEGGPTTLPWWAELGSRAVGFAPATLTETQLSQAQAKRTRQANAAARFAPIPPTPDQSPISLEAPRSETPILDRLREQALAALYGTSTPTAAAPDDLVARVIQAESAGRPTAVSRKGAVGLMQVLPSTAVDPGIPGVTDIFTLAQAAGVPVPQRGTPEQQAAVLLRNPALNRQFGVAYLTALLRRYAGDTRRALAAYNWGPDRVDRWDGRDASLPTETREYLAKILRP